MISILDRSLTLKEFSDQLATELKALDSVSAKDSRVLNNTKNRILQDFIVECLVTDFAGRNKIEVTKEEVDEEIRKVRSSFPDDNSFRKSLAEAGVSFIEWETRVRKSLLNQKVFTFINKEQTPISNTEIEALYKTRADRFKKKERVYLRQIVTDDFAKAETLVTQIKKSDFAETAKKYSVSPEKVNGGLVGWIERGSVDIFDKAFSLSPGAISQILESPYGFHILKVERKAAPGVASIEEVREILVSEIKAQREQALFTKWLDEQIRQVKVFKDQKLISSVQVETKGVRK